MPHKKQMYCRVLQFQLKNIVRFRYKYKVLFEQILQSGRCSLAKHGDAYFSAVYGFMKDPIAAPGPCENQEFQKLVGIAPAPTLFTTSTKHHGSC